jgi:hypothetical protein
MSFKVGDLVRRRSTVSGKDICRGDIGVVVSPGESGLIQVKFFRSQDEWGCVASLIEKIDV